MKNYIAQMIQDEEKLIKPNKSKKPKNYNGNLVELRQKREKLLIKKHKLNLQIKKYLKLNTAERDRIFKNIERLSTKIDDLNKEILKIQTGMQNNSQWFEDMI